MCQNTKIWHVFVADVALRRHTHALGVWQTTKLRPISGKWCVVRTLQTKDFQNFLDETIGKDLSITEVDKLFLRTRGGVSETTSIPISKWEKDGVRDRSQPFENTEREIYHYGKDMKPFRLFGFYEDGYFVIYMIDPAHEKHSK